MTPDADITALFWQHLRSDHTVMLGLEADAPTTLRPMTALMDPDTGQGPIWFFTSTDAAVQTGSATEDLAIFTFVAKGHEVFATVHGHLTRAHDPFAIDRLWNPWVAAWYEGGRDDPKLALMRFDPVSAEIWRKGSGLLAGLKLLFGASPRADFKDDVAKVSLA